MFRQTLCDCLYVRRQHAAEEAVTVRERTTSGRRSNPHRGAKGLGKPHGVVVSPVSIDIGTEHDHGPIGGIELVRDLAQLLKGQGEALWTRRSPA